MHKTAFEIQVPRMLAIKYRGDFRIFSLPWQYVGKKKLSKTLQKPYVTLAIALAYLSILPIAMLWFFSRPLVLRIYVILFNYNTLELVKRKTTFLSMITLFWFVCDPVIEEHVIEHQKSPELNIQQHGKSKASNANSVVTENQLKHYF